MIRKLKQGDEKILEAFLRRNANTTMHIRSNLEREGFNWTGKRQQGIYYGAFDDDGAITGMLGYFWNSNILMQPGEHLPALLDAIRQENVEIKGLLGPAKDVRKAIELLGLVQRDLQISRDEDVYILDLTDLVIPEQLQNGNILARPATQTDRDLVIRWRMEFNIEAVNAKDTPEVRREVEAEIDGKIDKESLTILEKDGIPVAMCGQDAALPDSVTIGPVWTPPEHRNKGYARAVVAGALKQTRDKGGTRSILFTDNEAAVKAYKAVGFKKADQYGLTLLNKPFSHG